MAVWAYQCRLCEGGSHTHFVARDAVDAMPQEVQRLRVKVDSQWLCALVDRTRAVQVEGMLLRNAVAAEAGDCAECDELFARLTSGQAGGGAVDVGAAADSAPSREAPPSASIGSAPAPRQVQAAAISIQGVNLVVVLVSLALVQSRGEAAMAIDDLRPLFGGPAVVLMGQYDDGAPVYFGDASLVALLADLPVDKMPWQDYTLG